MKESFNIKDYVFHQRQIEYRNLQNKAEEIGHSINYDKINKGNNDRKDSLSNSNSGFFSNKKNSEYGFKCLFEDKYNLYTPNSMISTRAISPTERQNLIKTTTKVCCCIDSNGNYIDKNCYHNKKKLPYFIDKNYSEKIRKEYSNNFNSSNNNYNNNAHNNENAIKINNNSFPTFKPNYIYNNNHNQEIKRKNNPSYNNTLERNTNNKNYINQDELTYYDVIEFPQNNILKNKINHLNKIKHSLKKQIENIDQSNNELTKSIKNKELDYNEIAEGHYNTRSMLNMINYGDEDDLEKVRIYLTNQRKNHLINLIPKVNKRSIYLYGNINKNTHCNTCANLLLRYRTSYFCPKCHS